MKFTVYILQSKKNNNKLYIGQTNNFERRLSEHTNNKVLSTKNKGPWEMVHSVHFNTRIESVRLETKLKKWKNPRKVLEWVNQFRGVAQPG